MTHCLHTYRDPQGFCLSCGERSDRRLAWSLAAMVAVVGAALWLVVAR